MKNSIRNEFEHLIYDEYIRMETIIKLLKRLLGDDHLRFLIYTLLNKKNYPSIHKYSIICCNPTADDGAHPTSGAYTINHDFPKLPFDIFTGLYFPPKYYKIGDTVDIYIGGQPVFTMTIDNPNKIYKPFCDFYWIYLIYLPYHNVLIHTKGKPFYAIGLNIPSNLIDYDKKSIIRHIAPNGTSLTYEHGMGIIRKSVKISTYDLPPYIRSANIIKRYIKKLMRDKEIYASMGPLVVYI